MLLGLQRMMKETGCICCPPGGAAAAPRVQQRGEGLVGPGAELLQPAVLRQQPQGRRVQGAEQGRRTAQAQGGEEDAVVDGGEDAVLVLGEQRVLVYWHVNEEQLHEEVDLDDEVGHEVVEEDVGVEAGEDE